MVDLTAEQKAGLQKLREDFSEKMRSFKPIAMCKKEEYQQLPKGKCNVCGGYHATSKTQHLEYVGHAALTKRLLDTDISWEWNPLALDGKGLPLFDEKGGLWIRLTVCGMTRLGYGQAVDNQYAEIGSRTKELIGDALRNAGMRFGMALELWHKGEFDDETIQQTGEVKKDAIKMPEAKSSAVEGGVAQAAASSAPSASVENAVGELAEAGEIAFITKKLSMLKATDPDSLMKEAAGITNLDGLTKANFLKLKEGIKGKK
jgi:hypothetical protein